MATKGEGSKAREGSQEEPVVIFERADENEEWFVDTFNWGQLLPSRFCRDALVRLGVPEAQHDAFMTPVPPVDVWTRIIRNVRAWHTREGRGEKARELELMTRGLSKVSQSEALGLGRPSDIHSPD